MFELLEEQITREITAQPQTTGQYILSVDEVGRGSVFGPVTVGAVLLPVQRASTLPETAFYRQVRDSKKLSRQQREKLAPLIKAEFQTAVSHVSVGFIEKYNINLAIQYGIYRLVQQFQRQLPGAIGAVLVDGNYRFVYPHLRMPQAMPRLFNFIEGDNRAFSIACASIVAKVSRDHLMQKAARRYPAYDLASNMGYGTALHRQALQQHGLCRHHRRSFLSRIC